MRKRGACDAVAYGLSWRPGRHDVIMKIIHRKPVPRHGSADRATDRRQIQLDIGHWHQTIALQVTLDTTATCSRTAFAHFPARTLSILSLRPFCISIGDNVGKTSVMERTSEWVEAYIIGHFGDSFSDQIMTQSAASKHWKKSVGRWDQTLVLEEPLHHVTVTTTLGWNGQAAARGGQARPGACHTTMCAVQLPAAAV